MKNKLPAILLAVGMTASPVFAKKANRKSDHDNSMKLEQSHSKQDRVANTVKRQKQLEMEKEFIKETEQEIAEALTGNEKSPEIKKYKSFKRDKNLKVVMKDTMPINGIDISDQFRIIHKSEST